MTDDLTLLASAYLDGEATPDERALVEADPTLLDEVERLRTARSALLDASGFVRPGDDAREAAIAAALTAWDLAALDPVSPTVVSQPAVRPSTVVPFVRRRTYTRWLSAAAAVAAVFGLGVLVAQLGTGDGSDDSAAVDVAADETTASGEARTEFSEANEPPADTALLSAEVAADDAGDAVSDSDGAGGADAPSAAPEATAAAESAAAPEVSLESPEELAMFAITAEQSDDSAPHRNALIPACAGKESEGIEYVATGTYRSRPVVVGIDSERENAIAVDSDTCAIVAEAPLP